MPGFSHLIDLRVKDLFGRAEVVTIRLRLGRFVPFFDGVDPKIFDPNTDDLAGITLGAFEAWCNAEEDAVLAEGAVPLTTAGLRSVRLAAVKSAVLAKRADPWPGSETRVGPRARLTHDHLAEVAELYKKAVSEGRHPSPPIAARYNVSKHTARSWAKKARQQGLLGDSDRAGKAGPSQPATTAVTPPATPPKDRTSATRKEPA